MKHTLAEVAADNTQRGVLYKAAHELAGCRREVLRVVDDDGVPATVDLAAQYRGDELGGADEACRVKRHDLLVLV